MKKLFTLLTLMVVSIATYGYTDIVTPGYAPAGGTFSDTLAIKWATQGLVASIDVSACSSSKDDQILTVGSKIDSYSANNSEVLHFYFKHNTSGEGGTLEVLYFSGNGDNSKICAKKSVNSDNLFIRMTQTGGVTVNGVSFNHKPQKTYTMGDSITTDISSYYSSIWALSSTIVGSNDGGTNAKYNFLRVVDLSENSVDVSGITAKTSFTKTVAVDWNSQELVASLNVSSCSSYGTEEILAIGNVIDKYSGYYNNNAETDVLHIYFQHNESGQGGTLEVIYFHTTQEVSTVRAKFAVTSDDLLIKFTKATGITVNGVSFNYQSKNTFETGDKIADSDISNYYTEIWALNSVLVGSAAGGSNAKYNYIKVQNLLTLDESADNSNMIATFKDVTLNTTLKRTLTVNKWNTFCVPFDIPSNNSLLNSTYFTVKEFDRVEGSTMYLKTATEMKAGKPYLIKPTVVTISNPRFENVTVTETSPVTVGGDTYKFVGVYSPKTFTEAEATKSLILVDGGKLVNPTASTMNGMRAYFTYPGATDGGNSVAPRLVIDGVETALTEVVDCEAISDGRIYNLRGMYVGNDASKLAKGVYIMNGKKVVLN